MSLMGLDVGTTGCKAIAVNLDGRVVAQAYRDYPLVSPRPGWNELDSTVVWKSIQHVISAVSHQVESDPIEAVSVSAQGEAVVAMGKGGDTLNNFIVTFDNRTEPQSRWWEKKLGKRALFEVTGMPLHPMYSINKIMWIKENSPDIYARVWKFLCMEDFVIFRLSGRPVIDFSLAARTMCFDVASKAWSGRVLSCADVDVGLLSEPRPSGFPVETVRKEMASELGLKTGVIVATGGHDQPCGALGAGAVRPGMMMNAIGTSDVLCPTLKEPVLSASMLNSNYCCYPHVIQGAYTTITFNLTGGLLLRWYRDTFCQEEVHEAARVHADPYDIIIGRASPHPADVYFLPHLVGSGTPTLDSESRGAIVGITLNTTKSDLCRAVLDSNNYDLKLNMDTLQRVGIPIEEIRAVGGGSKSATWLQMRADVLGKRISVPEVSEAASLGAAILAGVARGHFSDVHAGAEAWVKVARAYSPDMKMHDEYTGRFLNYLRLYPAMKKAGIAYSREGIT